MDEPIKRRKNVVTPLVNIDVDATQKEIEELAQNSNKVSEIGEYNFKISRSRNRLVNKATTPLYVLEEIFINYQKGKNNTPATIKYYEKVFRNLYRFVAFLTIDSSESYGKLLDDKRFKDETDAGKLIPIAVLESDDFESDYADFILNVLGSSEQTLNNVFRGYRAIAYYAMEQGWIDYHKIPIRDIEPPIKQVYTQEEINKLSKRPNLDNFVEYRDWVIIKFLLATGCRISSVASLKIDDIDFDEKYININVQKNRQPIRIAMVDSLASILKEYIYNYRCDDNGYPLYESYLFCSVYGKPCSGMVLAKSIAEYNKAHGVSKTSVHLFRHTFAKTWITSGGDIISLQKMLGHKSLKMVQRYANLYSSDIKPKAEEHSAINVYQTRAGTKKLIRRK